MKVVLFCGGQGTRLRDYSEHIPKPLVPVGGRPILWHMMNYYAAYGHTDFVLCLGYKGHAIRRFFLEQSRARAEAGRPRGEAGGSPPDVRDWRITFVDTGLDASIGERLLRVREYVDDEPVFLCNYADVLTDLDLDAMLAEFREGDAVAAFCAVTPPYSFHLVEMSGCRRVRRMMSLEESGLLMNGGYMVLRPQIFEYLHEGEELVVEAFGRLIEKNRLLAYRHHGFWMPMDTFKERTTLEDMAARGDTPWQVWKTRPTRARTDAA